MDVALAGTEPTRHSLQLIGGQEMRRQNLPGIITDTAGVGGQEIGDSEIAGVLPQKILKACDLLTGKQWRYCVGVLQLDFGWADS